MTNTILQSICTFPIKGFPGVKLEKTMLNQTEGVPNDRRFAVTRGVSPTGEWMPASSYYINAYVDGMMKFEMEMASDSHFTIKNPEGASINVPLGSDPDLSGINPQLAAFMGHVGVRADLPSPQIVERGKRGNWDYPDTPISIINLETARAISEALGVDMDPMRYRGNLLIDGLPAFAEFGWMGKRIGIGGAEIDIMRPIVRCPAPGVNPNGGERDIDFEKVFPELFGHAYCGMYAVVAKDGEASVSDKVEVTGDAGISLDAASEEAEDYRLWPRIVDITFCEIGEDVTRMSLSGRGPWPLPEAKPGQRLRFMMGPNRWTSEYIAKTTPGHYHLEIGKSKTGDPVTEHLRKTYKTGDQLTICGPFGRV